MYSVCVIGSANTTAIVASAGIVGQQQHNDDRNDDPNQAIAIEAVVMVAGAAVIHVG